MLNGVRRRRAARRLIGSALVLLIGLNAVAWQHAWQFTHFAEDGERTPDPAQMTTVGRLNLLLTGVTLPRPVARPCPVGYRALRIPLASGEWLGAWTAPALADLDRSGAAPARGTVLLLHGYGGEKGSLLDEAAYFRQLGYRVVLVDFRGGGASSGNEVTIGYREADDVRAVCQHLRRYWHEPNVVLFGVSMGAVAALRAMAEYPADVRPVAAVLESPFGSTYQTVVNRFQAMHVPPVPMAALLTFWGGVQHGYWAFGHVPTAYARRVAVPTLVLQGTADARVQVFEVEEIAAGLVGPKRLVLLPGAGHGHYIASRPQAWRAAVKALLQPDSTVSLATTPRLSGYLGRSRQVSGAASRLPARSRLAADVAR